MRNLAWTATLLAAVVSGSFAADKKKVVFVTWNESEVRYSSARKSMIEALAREGFNGSNMDVVLEDAAGDKAKVSAIVDKVKGKYDVYVAFGTSAATAVSKAVADKPVIFSVVYDPIEAKLAKDWRSSGNNVTGASNFVSIPAFMRRLIKRSSGYTIRKIGVLYTPGEKNSELQLTAVQTVEKELGVQVVPQPVASAADIAAWAKNPGVDLVYVGGSNIVAKSVPAIVAGLVKHKVLSATHLDDIVDKGVLFGLVADPVEVGEMSGKAMARVMKGEAPSAVPIAYPRPKLMINRKTAKEGGFSISQEIETWAAGAQ